MEPLNKEHIGIRSTVPCREAVLISEVYLSLSSEPRSGHPAFTSHYLANHLQDAMSTPPDQAPSPTLISNNTRNLANLSRLFRQLRPHLVNSERQTQRVKGSPYIWPKYSGTPLFQPPEMKTPLY